MAPSPPPAASPRLFFLDWLRILAFAALVPYHVGMLYVRWPWHVKSPHPVPALEPWLQLSEPWRMSLLFLVSGVATAALLQRQGHGAATLRRRAGRLLLPLLCGVLLVVPPQSWFEVQQRFGWHGSALAFYGLYLGGGSPAFCDAAGCLRLPTWNHLWFLPYLFVYTALLWLALRWQPQALGRGGALLARALQGAGLIGWPVLWLLLLRLALAARFPVTHALLDDPFAHGQYAAMFLLGAALAQTPLVWPRFARWRWPALAAALAAWAWLVGVVGLLGLVDAEPPTGAGRALALSVQQWCAIVAALGFAQRHLNRDGRWRRAFTDAVFPLYLLHQTVIIVLAMALAPAALPPVLEAPLLVAGTFALCALAVLVLRRLPRAQPWFGLAPRPAVGLH